jgi:hypothetical protein
MGNFSSATRIHNDLVTSTDNQGNFIPKPAHNPQIFINFRPKKYFKKISKKIQKTAKIFQNCEKVPESSLGRKLASLIFGNNFELHSHNGFRPKLGAEYPPTSRIDTAQ